MKRILLLLFLTVSLFGFNQHLDSLYISNNSNPNTIDVTTVVTNGSSFSLLDHSYSMSNDTIRLDVCYAIGLAAMIQTLTNTFEIIIPTGIDTFYLDLSINKATSTNCVTNETVDFAFLEFHYPLLYDISLGNFEKYDLPIQVYPNPVQNKLHINTNGKIVESIELYNFLGEKVLEKNSNQSHLEVGGIENGIYFLVVKTSAGHLKKKIIISN
jgi:hypothetical protein